MLDAKPERLIENTPHSVKQKRTLLGIAFPNSGWHLELEESA